VLIDKRDEIAVLLEGVAGPVFDEPIRGAITGRPRRRPVFYQPLQRLIKTGSLGTPLPATLFDVGE
jgi:hypothetical protein